MRIIAGKWRGRKLTVADVPGLRPTGDRVRETLFNWLQADVPSAHCLDLFAGSGALGFECLSRGAASVTFIEANAAACSTLHSSAAQLGVEAAANDPVEIVQGTATDWLSGSSRRFDLVFIDPPFDAWVQWDVLEAIQPHHLSERAGVYVETPVKQPLPDVLPHDLCVFKDKVFGEVHARLLRPDR